MSIPRSKQPDYVSRYNLRYRQLYRTNESKFLPILPYERMVQALCAIGYTREFIATEVGSSGVAMHNIVYSKRKSIRPELAARIEQTYYRLRLKPAPEDRYSRKAIREARARLWASPLEWDDIKNDLCPTSDEEAA